MKIIREHKNKQKKLNKRHKKYVQNENKHEKYKKPKI